MGVHWGEVESQAGRGRPARAGRIVSPPKKVCHTPAPRASGTPLVSRPARTANRLPTPWDSYPGKIARKIRLPN